MIEELKPCPFCGEKAIIIRGSDDYFRCGCEENCDLTSRDRDEAIDAWNTRKIEDALRAELARKDELVTAIENLADINGQLYVHSEMCIRKFMSFSKITQEDGDNHQNLLDCRDIAISRIAKLRKGGRA